MMINTFSQNEFNSCGNPGRPVANQMFNRSRNASLLCVVKSLFTRKLRMPSLSEQTAGRGIRAQHFLGMRSVEIERIAGTESKADAFDAEFHPRDDRIRERWVGIAEARLRQINLPAVDLIQVGEVYFVRDGHHRISVARALGNAYIDAQVTVIELN